MIIRSIQLNNFGLYAGRCEIDLVPRKTATESKPIVLIGGKNGAGKTTLLNGLRLALYGRRALGARVSQSDYDDYLRKCIYKGAAVQSAGVGLEFDYAEAGVVYRYRVLRDWVARGKSVIETLFLEKDGTELTSVPRDEWHQFLQELIPPGVSQLFFFDGEKIREIADADGTNEQLAQAVRGLLGVDLVERARTDLGLYMARHESRENNDTAVRLENVIRDLQVQDTRFSELLAEVAELTSRRDSQARASELVRRRFVSEGGDVAAKRGRIEAERDEVRRQTATCLQHAKELANGLLPIAAAPRLMARFRDALIQSIEVRGSTSDLGAILKALDMWKAKPAKNRTAKWTPAHWSDMERFLRESSRAENLTCSVAQRLPEIADSTAMLSRVRELELITRPRALALCAELDALAIRLADLDTSLARADSATAGYLLDELRLTEQQVGSSDAALKAKEEQLKAALGKRTLLERERRSLLEQQASEASSHHKVELAGRTALVLAAFERRLLEKKLHHLRTEFVRYFNHIARKSDLIADIIIDADTFSTSLIDQAGRLVAKTSLSAGEQQVYAISMLWALAKTSGRPLPMVIDTPLARLDSEHRANLIERYFPLASHQVVLLSTDTEIDDGLLSSLGTAVSHTYRVEYEPDGSCATITPGYFNKLPKRRTVSAL